MTQSWLITAGQVLRGLCDASLSCESPHSIRASWYLTPERHIVEYCVAAVIGPALLWLSMRKLNAVRRAALSSPSLAPVSRMDAIVAASMFASVAVVVAGKIHPCFTESPPSYLRLYFLLMPCHIMSVLLAWLLLTRHRHNEFLFNLALCCSFGQCVPPLPLSPPSQSPLTRLPLVCARACACVRVRVLPRRVSGIVFPDTRGYTMPLEIEAYWAQHILLVLLPFYLQWRGIYATYPSATWTSLAAFSAMFVWLFLVITPVCLLGNVNLLYMVAPPRLPFASGFGANYRIYFTCLVAVMIAISRLLFGDLPVLALRRARGAVSLVKAKAPSMVLAKQKLL